MDRVSDSEEKPCSTEDPAGSGTRKRRLLGPALLLLALPTVILAVSMFTGFGLEQNLPSQVAFAGALCAVVMPSLGIASVLGASLPAHGLAFLAWSIALMLAFPGYLPERREPATRTGLEYLSESLGESVRERFVDTGLEMLRVYGEEPEPIVRAERHVAANLPPPVRTAIAESRVEAERAPTAIPYSGEGQTIVIPAHVDGPDFGERWQFVFDTGATLTTLTRDALETLGIELDRDAPKVTLRTAAGEMDARLALVDAIWLDEEVVEWVTVAVCESCASTTTVGLLGLNVSSHFRVSIDHESERIELVPRPGRRNRKLDIQPWLELSSVLRRWDDGRLELNVDVTNRSRQGIRSCVLEVKCADETFTISLDPISAFGSRSQTASLPRNTDCENFAIRPLTAAWETERF